MGFAATRSGFMSLEDQKEAIIEYGVEKDHIYTPENSLKECLKSCTKGDELVVYSARALGVQADLKSTVQTLAKKQCVLVILDSEEPLKVNCVDSLPYTYAVESINKRNVKLGEEHGRHKLITPAVADKIKHFVSIQGNSQSLAATKFDTSTRAVSDIMNNKYFKKYRGKASK